MNTENSTPEWFQMAQEDGFAPKPKSKRVIRVIAMASPLLVLGAGLVFASTQESPIAVASSAASPTHSSTTPMAVSSTAAANTATTPAATAPSAASATDLVVQASQTTSSTPTLRVSAPIKKPALTMPTGGEDDAAPSIAVDNVVRTSDDD